MSASRPPAKGRLPGQLPPGRHGLPREVVVRDQRERILTAVAQVGRDLGYARMSVEDIIACAGISRRTFYDLFKGKEDVFLAAYDAAVERLLAEVEKAYEAERDWIPAVRSGLARLLALLAAEPEFADLCLVQVLAAGPRALERRTALLKRWVRFVEPGEQQARRAPVPPLAAESVIGGIHEIVYSRLVSERADELPRLLPDLLYVVLLPYLGHAAARRHYAALAGERGGEAPKGRAVAPER